jgi:hypothetical protein
MKITNFKAKILNYLVITLFLLSLASLIVSCGPFKPKYTDLRKIPGDPKGKRERNIREGRGFRAMGYLEKKGSGNFQFASSNEMWRATLDLLDFTPLSNVDYSGGIIITDWFSEGSDQDPIKITVRFLSNEIRADGLKVIIHKKICKKIDDCKVIKVDSTLGQEIKLAILKKAAIIAKSEISEGQKNYSQRGILSDD